MAGRKKTGRGKAPMTEDHLVAEGRRLARPVVTLVASRSEAVAFWGGQPVVEPPADGEFRHWLSVACSALPTGVVTARSGWLSVFTDDDQRGVVTVDLQARTPRRAPKGSTALAVGERAEALPPPEGVFALGDELVQAWVEAGGEGDRDLVDSYMRHVFDEWAFYRSDEPKLHAQLGGWHMPWPEDSDFVTARRLAVWTFAESEPWVEAWEEAGAFRVLQRIT